MPVMDMFWGDRSGVISDPDGNKWMIATHKSEPTEARDGGSNASDGTSLTAQANAASAGVKVNIQTSMSHPDTWISPLCSANDLGFAEFRPAQQQVIDKVMAGENVLAVMPTGSGKSLCYQLPALAFPGLTLVVSPLIALMKDQVDHLNQLGFPATVINSTVSREQQRSRLEQAISGKMKLLVHRSRAFPER